MGKDKEKSGVTLDDRQKAVIQVLSAQVASSSLLDQTGDRLNQRVDQAVNLVDKAIEATK